MPSALGHPLVRSQCLWFAKRHRYKLLQRWFHKHNLLYCTWATTYTVEAYRLWLVAHYHGLDSERACHLGLYLSKKESWRVQTHSQASYQLLRLLYCSDFWGMMAMLLIWKLSMPRRLATRSCACISSYNCGFIRP